MARHMAASFSALHFRRCASSTQLCCSYPCFRATTSNENFSSSFTLSDPPATDTNSIPKSLCKRVKLPMALNDSPVRETRAGILRLRVVPCKVRSPFEAAQYCPSPVLLAETLEQVYKISGYS